MSKTSVISLAVSINGDGACVNYTPPQSPITNPNAPEGGPIAVALASGANTIPVPSGATSVLVVPPSASTNAKQLKTLSGDTGITFTSQLQVINVTGLSSVYITSAAAESMSLVWA